MDTKEEIVPAFFCVPDITGFTKFITTADINFSRSVISTILAKLVKANMLKMEVAEIEGDAVIFYKTGRLPAFKQICKQCDLLLKEFYDYIKEIKTKDEANYNLYFDGQIGLKIIIHFGKVIKTRIHNRVKLIGEDVIVVHKLLKNGIPESEYILVTDAYLKKIKFNTNDTLFDWSKLTQCSESYDYIGEVHYRYIPVDVEKYLHS